MRVENSPDAARVDQPLGRWFTMLRHFDRVPLPDGRQFALRDGKLWEERAGALVRADISVNELLECLSELSSQVWREILSGSSGDQAARKWRDKILAAGK